MFSARELPEPREPHVAVRVQLPRRLADWLNREAAARRSPLTSTTQARDEIVAAALETILQPVATPRHSEGSPT